MINSYEIVKDLLLSEALEKSKCIVLGKEVPCTWNKQFSKFVTPGIIKTASMHVTKNWPNIINLAKQHYSKYLYKWFNEHSSSEKGMASFIKQLIPSRIFIVIDPNSNKYDGCHVSIHGSAMFDKLMGHELSVTISANGQLQEMGLHG